MTANGSGFSSTGEMEPRWRWVLNWSAVIAFFAMPVAFFTLQVAAIQLPWLRFEEHIKEFGWTRDYFKIVCMLVLGLAGLNSWDRHNGRK